MAESAAYSRIGFKGAAKASTLVGNINSSATTIPGADLSSWAGAPANGPIRWTLNRGKSDEESGEAISVSGNNLLGVTRGLFGTVAQSHNDGATLELVAVYRDFDEANLAVTNTVGKITTLGDLLVGSGANAAKRLGVGTAFQSPQVNAGATDLVYGATARSTLSTTGDLLVASAANVLGRLAVGTGTQFLKGGTTPAWGAASGVFYTVHTWAIAGAIAVPVGDTDFINPMFAGVGVNETVVLDKVRYVINSGTSVTFKLQKNGVDATGFTALSCTTIAATTDPADVSVADLDKLAPVVTAVSGTPKNMTISIYLKHTVTVT